MKVVIKQAIDRVIAGNCTDEDKAIKYLLEQCRDLKIRLETSGNNGAENHDVPVHKANPWYMQ